MSQSNSLSGRMLDGQLTLVLTPQADVPAVGYTVTTHDGRLWRNGKHVGRVRSLRFDRDALGWWIEYTTWRGSPLDHPAVVR